MVTTVITIQHLLNFSTGSLSGSAFSIVSPPLQRRRLVINIGGQKFGSQILGGQKFWENLFSDKKSRKSSLLFSPKFLTTFFKKHRQLLFTKFTPFIQNVLRFLCIVVSVSAFFHVYFF